MCQVMGMTQIEDFQPIKKLKNKNNRKLDVNYYNYKEAIILINYLWLFPEQLQIAVLQINSNYFFQREVPRNVS